MTISCIIASHGADSWRRLASERAFPSTEGQGFHEVLDIWDRDGTVASVRNAGAFSASGDWLLFLDADDQLAPGFGDEIRTAIDSHVTHPDFPRFGFTPSVAYTSFRRDGRIPIGKIWSRLDLKDGNWMVIGTVVPRRAFLQVGGFREWPMYEDWCLWQRLDRNGLSWVEVPDALYLAYASPNSRNRKPSRAARLAAHEAIRRSNYPELYEKE